MSASNSVYISYSWKAEDKSDTVEKLLATFASHGVEVKRDINEIGYGDSIRKYLDELAAGGAVVLILSEPYFKSLNCMYELREIYLNDRKEFRNRIFPVVLHGTRFHQTAHRIPYITFWQEETKKLKAALASVDTENIGAVSHQEVRDHADFCRIIDELQSLIADINHLTEEEHLRTGFSLLVERIFTKHRSSAYAASHPAGLAPLFGVPNLPNRYMERLDYLDQFRETLLLGQVQTVGITGRPEYVGVQGMGGLGKSVLAAALACDVQVRRAFPDGIFWLRFGKEIRDDGLLELQKEILLLFAPDSKPESPAQGRNSLNIALQSKRCLFIADDLWDSCHLNFFDIVDSDCRFLITTRNAKVIEEAGARLCELHLLSAKQARELLAKYSGFDEEDLPEEAEAILRECKRLPLAIAAIGSMVNGKGRNRWQLALDKLQNARLDKIPVKFDRYSSYENLFKVFQVSVEDLPPEVQAYFKTMLVFPEDVKIPESVLQLYWKYLEQGNFEPLDAVDLLVQRSLLSPAANESFTLHDLLRDYLVFESGGDITEFHKHLLEAYKVAYPGGWHTIPFEKGSYFHNYWSVHVQATGEIAQASSIADTLIRLQPLLNHRGLLEALQFTDYEFADIAASIIKTNKNPNVVVECLKTLGSYAKEDARRLLKESQNSNVLAPCLTILGDEAKKDARRLLRESQNSNVLVTCLTILGKEAKEDARRLLKESQNSNVLAPCLTILGDEAKEDARRLLRESQNSYVLVTCLTILGKEAKEDARRLLKESMNSHIVACCLSILGDEAKEDAQQLIKETVDHNIVKMCLKILGEDAKDDAKRLLKESDSEHILLSCLYLLGDEAKKEARQLLKTSKYEMVLVTCISILGKEAKADAIRLSKTGKNRLIRNKCEELIYSWETSFWETSLGGRFPELYQLKNNLAGD